MKEITQRYNLEPKVDKKKKQDEETAALRKFISPEDQKKIEGPKTSP